MPNNLQQDLKELFSLLAKDPNALVPIASQIICSQAELRQEQTAAVPQASP